MDANPFRDYYADLGIEYGSSLTAIKSAFYALAKQHHPDKSGTTDSSEFRRVREAYENLSDAAYRAAYDRDYQGKNQGTAANDNVNIGQDSGPTRTEAFEAEMAEERPPSPRPPKPYIYVQQSMEEYLSSARYKEWKVKDNAHRARHPNRDQEEQEAYDNMNWPPYAHGLRVQMTSHPAIRQRCVNRIENWKMQAAGTDICVFCMVSTKDGTRCPGCEVLACANCLKALVVLEYRRFGGIAAGRQFRPSGA